MFGGIAVPQRVICSVCKTVLYEGLELEPPIEIIQRNNGSCPKCGRKLDYDSNSLKLETKDDSEPILEPQ